MHPDAARAIERPPVLVGETRTFYSTLQGIDGRGIYPCLYSGQECRVLRETLAPGSPDWSDEESERMYEVEFTDGAITEVWEGEINGWFFDTGQWHGPFAVEVRHGDERADFEINDPRREPIADSRADNDRNAAEEARQAETRD